MAPATEKAKAIDKPHLAADLVRRQVAVMVERVGELLRISGGGGNLRDPKWF